MSYPIFGKVKTITLPIPASSMSNKEYFEAYGIDLQNDKLGDLILMRDGEDTYPVLYNDTENKILYTADKAFDYSSGLEVIQDKSLISEVIAGGTIENAKPLYYHPLFVQRISDYPKYALSFTIIDNDPTPYTLARFKDFIDNLNASLDTTIRMNSSGGWSNGVDTISSVCLVARPNNSPNYVILGFENGEKKEVVLSWANMFSTPFEFQDGVNKIN